MSKFIYNLFFVFSQSQFGFTGFQNPPKICTHFSLTPENLTKKFFGQMQQLY